MKYRATGAGFLIIISIVLLVTCEKPERVVQFTTLDAQISDISYTTATLKGEITDAGSKSIEDHGILISADANPRVGNATIKSLGARASKGVFTVNVTELTLNTTYYYRAYVTIDGLDINAEKICSFKTLDTEPPTVTAGSVTAITMTSASLSGEVTSDGGESATIRGLCWGSSANPTIATCLDTTKNGTGAGAFTGTMTGLTQGTQYYARTYATNSKGTSYNSADIIFTTHDLPEVTTENVTDVTKTTAVSGGNVTDDGGVEVTARGVCWDTSTEPTSDLETRTNDGTGTGTFASEITGLSEGIQYYIRAYAENQYGTSYGEEKTFTTLSAAPAVVTGSATSVTETAATLNGTVNANEYSTTVTFEYGLTTSYGLEAAADQSPVTGTTSTAVSVDISGLTESTTYHYRIKAVSSGGTTYGDDMEFTTTETILPPSATTGSATSVTTTSATLNGTVNANDLSTTVTFEYGLTTAYGSELTAAESPVTGTTATSVSYDLSGLTASTTYHYRVKAVSMGGTVYGDDMEFSTNALPTVSDYDGNTYIIITIGPQEWIQENLKTTHYNNGDIIANITDNTEWSNLGSGAYCWYNNDEGTYKNPYGALYTWWTTVDVRNICPAGWHVPTDAEWSTLVDYLGGETVAGGKLKETGTTHWTSPNTGATNETGFTALPGSFRSNDGTFDNIGNNGNYWSSTESLSGSAWSRNMSYENADAHRDNNNRQEYGFSVRCVKGELPLAQTEDPSPLTAFSATLNGRVNPNNASTTVTFEYGLTDSYGSEVTASESPVTGTTPVTVSAGISGLSEATTYHYRVKAVNSYGTTYGNDLLFTTGQLPEVTTNVITDITVTTATGGGEVTSDGGAAVNEYGICWSTSNNPTINDSKTNDGSGTGTFVSSMTELETVTTYYVRAYATNSAGTAYGNEVSFTTNDPATIVFSIMGSETGWSSDIDLTYISTTLNTSKYQIDSRLFIQDELFIIRKNHDWATVYGYNELTILGEPSNFEESSTNIKVLSERTYEVIFEINWITEETTLTMNNLTIFGIIGSETAWGGEPDVEFTYIETISNVSTYYIETRLFIEGEQFKIRKDHDWTVSYGYSDLTITGELSNLAENGENIEVLSERTYELTLEIAWMTGNVTLTMNNLTPSITTAETTAVASQSAVSGGEVLNEGTSSVTARGVCWSTTSKPALTGLKTIDGSGTGIFASTVIVLTPNTTYFLRAYATNSAGTSYGNEKSFTTPGQVTDADGNTYNTVIIGTQVWMQKNLKTTKFNEGTDIPLVTDESAWVSSGTSAYCWYNNDAASYGNTYGALYNGIAVNSGMLCPTGWHVSTDAEWTTLEDYLGGASVAGGKLKEAGFTHWASPNTGATNETGFTALPGGLRYNDDGIFYYVGSYASFWSIVGPGSFLERDMDSNNSEVKEYEALFQDGLSVRCVKD